MLWMFPGSWGYNIFGLIRSALSKTTKWIGEKRHKKWEIFTAMPISSFRLLLPITETKGCIKRDLHTVFGVTTQAGQTVKAQVFEKKSHHDLWKKGEQYWEAPKLPLFGRAWAFQERLLATRVIHYTQTELVWECWSYIGCECGDLQNPQTGWPEFDGGGKNLKTKYGEVARWGNDNDRLKLWHNICAQYNARQLTYPTDRLPALASIAKRMHKQELLGDYLAGIWEYTLPKGLFWWSDTTHLTPCSSRNATHWRDKTHNIPTWSWLSIEGRVCTWGRIHTSLIDILNVSYTVGS